MIQELIKKWYQIENERKYFYEKYRNTLRELDTIEKQIFENIPIEKRNTLSITLSSGNKINFNEISANNPISKKFLISSLNEYEKFNPSFSANNCLKFILKQRPVRKEWKIIMK